MSIATDEAEQWAQSRYVGSSHIERHDGRAVSVPNYPQKINLRREGYIAGRTAEPTDAEIKAAVRAMYYRHAADWESDEDYARHLLEAARKAVTE